MLQLLISQSLQRVPRRDAATTIIFWRARAEAASKAMSSTCLHAFLAGFGVRHVMLYYSIWVRERGKRTKLLYGFAVDETVRFPVSDGWRCLVVVSLREFGELGKGDAANIREK